MQRSTLGTTGRPGRTAFSPVADVATRSTDLRFGCESQAFRKKAVCIFPRQNPPFEPRQDCRHRLRAGSSLQSPSGPSEWPSVPSAMAGNLTARKVQTAKAGKYSDGANLYLIVSLSGSRKWVLRFTWRGKAKEMGLGSATTVDLADTREKAAAARRKIARGVNPIEDRKRDNGIPTFGEMADNVRESLSAGFRNEKHKAQWKSTLKTYAAPLRGKPVDSIVTDDVLSVLKAIWTTKPETASRLRGRIEKVLDAAKAKGFRDGENPARWRGHLDHLLPRPSKLERGHHAAMPYEDVAAFVGQLRSREATAALALEFCILTAARSGEVLGSRWSEIDLNKKVWIV